MTGLIWFVQVVHYPLFTAVGASEFTAYEQQHTRLTAWVVGPFMAVEGVSALAILALRPDGVALWLILAGLLLLAVIHASTIFLQVPAHGVLTERFDADTVDRLVHTNWVRTAGWSFRSVLAGVMVVMSA